MRDSLESFMKELFVAEITDEQSQLEEGTRLARELWQKESPSASSPSASSPSKSSSGRDSGTSSTQPLDAQPATRGRVGAVVADPDHGDQVEQDLVGSRGRGVSRVRLRDGLHRQ